MKKKLGYTITETEVSFGDALFRLYRFGKTQDYTQKASHIPILHKHPFYEIMLCTAYGYRVVTEDSDIFLLPNNFLLVNPQKLHCAVGSVGKPPLSFGILFYYDKSLF